MALHIDMQVRNELCLYVNPYHAERGGVLSLTTLSGVQYAVYELNPSQSTVPLGIQQHDQEGVDFCRQLPPWRLRKAYPEFTRYPYLVEGTVVTNAVFPDIDAYTVQPGAPFFLAPSGLITSDTTFNSKPLGTFQSSLNDESLRIPGGAQASFLRVGGRQSIINPDPLLINTAGWVRISVNI